MKKRCLDEAILQAYMDGELSPERTAEAAAHLTVCDACAGALAEAEGENSLFAAAFAPDEALSVPTEILRARIGAAVARLEESAPVTKPAGGRATRLGGFLASISGLFNFTPQSAAAFASVLVVVAAGTIYFSVQRSRQAPVAEVRVPEIARVDSTPAPAVKTTPEVAAPEAVAPPAPSNEVKGGAAPVYAAASYGSRRRAGRAAAERRPAARAADEVTVPGEKEYQAAIASLERTIKLGGEATLGPSLRADYERNLALLDTAISQTRSVAAKNPKDKDAVGFLMAAYESKVELLTKVADQAQVATLGR